MLFESRPWIGMGSRNLEEYSASQVDLQITSKVRLVVLHYINFTTGAADLTIFVR